MNQNYFLKLILITVTLSVSLLVEGNYAYSQDLNLLKILRVSSNADTVTSGQKDISVKLLVQNIGNKNAQIILTKLIFKHDSFDISNQFFVLENNNNPDLIKKDSTATFNFSVTISETSEFGDIVIDGEINGVIENSNKQLIDIGADTTEAWFILEPASPTITYLNASQSNVTQKQEKDWYIWMAIQNTGGASISLDSAKISIFIGTDKTHEYTIINPTNFRSGSQILKANQHDSLRFIVDKTGNTTGPANIQGKLWATDVVSNKNLLIQTNDNSGNVTIQTPASLSINSLYPSQPTITAGQEEDWSVEVNISNQGESSIVIDTSAVYSNLICQIENNFLDDFKVKQPLGLNLQPGNFVLDGEQNASLVFTVDKTTHTLGDCQILVTIGGHEINSDRLLSDSLTASVIIVRPASIYILSTNNNALNHPHVNIGQSYNIDVTIINDRDEIINNIIVALETNGASRFGSPISIHNIDPDSLAIVSFHVVASNIIDSIETFTANILSAESTNLGENVAISPSVDSTAMAIIETPASLYIESILFSEGTIKAGQTFPNTWNLNVVVQNAGGASLTFAPFGNSDITFKYNGNIQNDYVILPPDVLKSGTLNLSGGTKDTLIYIIHTTGVSVGQIGMMANLSAFDDNTKTLLTTTYLDSITINPSTILSISSTKTLLPNSPDVNINQTFYILCSVENLGLEAAEDIFLSIATDGKSKIVNFLQHISILPAKSFKDVLFEVQSDSLENLVGETFAINVDSAKSVTGMSAIIKSPLDNNTLIRIESPAVALLELTIDDSDGLLGAGEITNVSATITNIGRSKLKGDAIIELIMPNNYYRIIPGDTIYTVKDTVHISESTTFEWQMLTPNQSQGPDTLVAAWIVQPIDENTDSLAITLSHADSLIVTTIGQYDITSTTEICSPIGAMDGILSTNQQFKIRVIAKPPSNLTDLEGKLILPENYTINDIDTKQFEEDTINWTIQSPTNEDINEKYLIIQFQAKDKDGSFFALSPDTMKIKTVKKTILSLTAQIIDPPGSTDGILAFNQEFTIQAIVTNLGQANIYGLSELSLNIGITGITVTESLIRPFTFNSHTKISDPIIWHGKAPNHKLSALPITINIETVPFDENSNEISEIIFPQVQLSISTVESARISNTLEISEPLGAQDRILSTGQTFTIRAFIHSNNCENIHTELVFPEGSLFFAEIPLRTVSTGLDSISWIIKAPNTPIRNAEIKVISYAEDINTNQQIYSSPDSIILAVNKKPELGISSSIQKSIVSVGEEFILSSTVDNYGEANLLNEAKLKLRLPSLFSTMDDSIKETSQLTTFWKIRAPSTPSISPQNITVLYEEIPLDENTFDYAEVRIPFNMTTISVVENQLHILNFRLSDQTIVTKGEQNVFLFGLELQNMNSLGTNAIHVNQIQLDMKGISSDYISPQSIFSEIKVCDMEDPTKIFSIISDLPRENPILIPFSRTLILDPGDQFTNLGIYADISKDASNDHFFVTIENKDYIIAYDSITLNNIAIINEDANPLDEIYFRSDQFMILDADFNNVFGNYPNPFGRSDRLTTKFVYYLGNDTNGEIRIYTLTGDLVWRKPFKSEDKEGRQGIHDGDITWNGKNGNGYVVLNGVYIAVLSTTDGNRAVTKIAYVK
jgi:hypothetical protein